MNNENNILFSIICVFNNRDILDNMLLKSINNQTIVPEIVAIDNCENKFPSAATALNYGASISNGKYLIFVHQDLEISDEMFLVKVKNYFEKLGSVILGIAGKNVEDKSVYTNIKHGKNYEFAGNKRVDNPVIVNTLDEVLIAIPRELFDLYKFDETTCSNWHLYGVDLCLTLGANKIKSYVIPCDGYHKSSGSVNNDFVKTLKQMIKKHKRNHKQISSTFIDVKTNFISYFIYRIKVVLLRLKLIYTLKKYITKVMSKNSK